jgi:hypothetical protein
MGKVCLDRQVALGSATPPAGGLGRRVCVDATARGARRRPGLERVAEPLFELVFLQKFVLKCNK